MTPIEELKKGLDELGVEYDTYDLPNGEHGLSWIDSNNIEWEAVQQGENFRIHALQLVTPEQAIAATVGKDIEHYDSSGRRGTVAILQGDRKPDEVLFVSYEGGVTHYLPEDATVGAGTCHIEECEHEREIPYDLQDCDGGELWFTDVTYDCDECGYENIDQNIRFCGGCGRRIEEE